ncbi:unnamed protein product [Eruca vesicaria subsp. sativa]|uniref:Uncharacterized protein n=1 Tax=Eruca vesicaria subsp. sativa TaxID=29727 RepID=A0ABC8K5A2_ERUVS|nr:unnamed protein product [Eruca vesicaria subsp. sativa]
MSSSIMKTLQIRKPTSLPVSSTAANAGEPGLLRRRLSSLSLNLSRNQPSTDDFHSSKSVSSMGEQGGSSMKEWWEWSWSLMILLKKLPIFFTADLEFNKDGTKSFFGNQERGSLAQVFFRLRSEIRRLLRTSSSDSLPLSCNR